MFRDRAEAVDNRGLGKHFTILFWYLKFLQTRLSQGTYVLRLSNLHVLTDMLIISVTALRVQESLRQKNRQNVQVMTGRCGQRFFLSILKKSALKTAAMTESEKEGK